MTSNKKRGETLPRKGRRRSGEEDRRQDPTDLKKIYIYI